MTTKKSGSSQSSGIVSKTSGRKYFTPEAIPSKAIKKRAAKKATKKAAKKK
jgi:hypothetical protein